MRKISVEIKEDLKVCRTCEMQKPLAEFNKVSKTSLYYRGYCKNCHQDYVTKYNKNNPEKRKIYAKRWEDKKHLENLKKRRAEVDSKSKRDKIRYQNKREEILLHRANNRQKIAAYQNHKYKTDINYRLARVLRRRLWSITKKGIKTGSSVKDLGCSLAELKTWIESKFKLGMTWDNHGEWHMDHVMPLSRFNLADREQFLKACHYSNLQPLWAEENHKKGNKVPKGIHKHVNRMKSDFTLDFFVNICTLITKNTILKDR
jgi:hypothetical protein